MFSYSTIKRCFIWSFFLIFSILFPVLNSIELLFFQTQKTFAIVCLILAWVLFFIFLIFPKIYDFSLNLLFKEYSKVSLTLFRLGNESIKKHPYLVG